MRTLTASAIICLCAVMAGCTHNNGDIGLWFGRWQLTEISADRNPLTEYSGNMSWAFQRDIVGITTVTDYHSALETWGQWKSDDNTYLSLNFDYTWDHPENISPSFTPPAILHFPAKHEGEPYPPVMLDIVEQTSSRMTLTYHSAADGVLYTYKFRKQ